MDEHMFVAIRKKENDDFFVQKFERLTIGTGSEIVVE